MKQSAKYRIFRIGIVVNRFVDIGKGVKHSDKKVCRNVAVVRITKTSLFLGLIPVDPVYSQKT